MVRRETRVNLLIGTNHGLSHFYQLCLPPLFLPWHAAFGVSFAELGLSVALMLFFTGVLQTPMGALVDRYGARPFLIGGSLLMSGGMLGMSVATQYWQVLVLASLSGIGNSVIHPADYAILSGSIRKEVIGRSFALHSLSGNIGFAVAPAFMIAMMEIVGWRGAVAVSGVVGLIAMASIVLQTRILGDQPKKETATITTRELFASRTLWLFFGFYMLSSMAMSGMQTWLITVLHQVNGFDLAVGSTALTVLLVGNSGGTILGGWAADRLNQVLLLFVVSLTVLTAALLVTAAVLPLGVLAMMVVLAGAGFAMGASRTPRDVMLKEASPPGQIGKVFGFVSSGLPFGSAATPLPFGYLMDHGQPGLVLPLAGGLLLASLLCMGTARISATSEASAVVPAE
jgi:FSR family fosmidomycin resistance protein-like MFS transporter